MIESVRIQNYKSIADLTLELGRFNVLIGENGCGKTNILEALAFAAEGIEGTIAHEALQMRGVRVGRPEITANAFEAPRSDFMAILVDVIASEHRRPIGMSFVCPEHLPNSHWLSATGSMATVASLEFLSASLLDRYKSVPTQIQDALELAKRDVAQLSSLANFVIYSALTPALRGTDVISRRTPLGIHGEGLDVVIANLPEADLAELCERAKCISWLGDLFVDRGDELKLQGHKLGRSLSRLYFRDRFMAEGRDVFSAENANEGVLHVLFHLALLLAPDTPKVFGVDNFDTALNPRLCRELTKEMAALAKSRERQCLVTTHNPAALDGLNLHDPDQRLFVVSRDDEGRTVAKRITLKPQPEGPTKFKLSELWMRGHLGGLPTHF